MDPHDTRRHGMSREAPGPLRMFQSRGNLGIIEALGGQGTNDEILHIGDGDYVAAYRNCGIGR